MSDYETLRRRHAKECQALLPEYIERITWPAERLRNEREQRLRALIRVAKERSPWHRERLTQIEPDRVTEADLPDIPPMRKDDLMRNFDDILTEPRLSQQVVEAHLAALTDDAYLLDEYHVVASGGSSGTRGVFVYGWEAWLICFLTMSRFRERYLQSGAQAGLTGAIANIAAGKATHLSYAMARTFRREGVSFTPVPATLPLAEMVERLNDLQPVLIYGYPSLLYALAREATAGRLRITPRMIAPHAEPLLPEMRAAIETVWGCPILNAYGASEGVSAGSCGEGRGMHLSEDAAVFELVDKDGHPVSPGVRAAKMYVTNLYNHVQPLIRYELTDEVTLIDEPCPCGSRMRRIDDIEGRTDDVFPYPGNVFVHPLTFRSPLGREPNIIEYQVTQTGHGAAIALRTQGSVDLEWLRTNVERELAALGLRQPVVTVAVVDSFDRQQTGKLKRFIPLPPAG